jgi:hypothetical protein
MMLPVVVQCLASCYLGGTGDLSSLSALPLTAVVQPPVAHGPDEGDPAVIDEDSGPRFEEWVMRVWNTYADRYHALLRVTQQHPGQDGTEILRALEERLTLARTVSAKLVGWGRAELSEATEYGLMLELGVPALLSGLPAATWFSPKRPDREPPFIISDAGPPGVYSELIPFSAMRIRNLAYIGDARGVADAMRAHLGMVHAAAAGLTFGHIVQGWRVIHSATGAIQALMEEGRLPEGSSRKMLEAVLRARPDINVEAVYEAEFIDRLSILLLMLCEDVSGADWEEIEAHARLAYFTDPAVVATVPDLAARNLDPLAGRPLKPEIPGHSVETLKTQFSVTRPGRVDLHVGVLLVAFDLLAAALAVQAYYEVEGVLPDTLDHLVTQYLPHVPLDPFTGDALKYRVERDSGAATVIVYSSGSDGVDHSGTGLFGSSGQMQHVPDGGSDYGLIIRFPEGPRGPK